MKTPCEWVVEIRGRHPGRCECSRFGAIFDPDVRDIQADARADLEAENKQLREAVDNATRREAENANRKRDIIESLKGENKRLRDALAGILRHFTAEHIDQVSGSDAGTAASKALESSNDE